MEKLNVYLANLMVGNVKLHNLHWNVRGISFKAVHEYLEELYNASFGKFDEVAELQKMKGVYPKASVKEFMEITTIKELESKPYTVKESLEYALEYIKEMRTLAAEIRKSADETDDFSLVDMMEEHIDEYNKNAWFLESMLEK